jgi:hypothetical protein
MEVKEYESSKLKFISLNVLSRAAAFNLQLCPVLISTPKLSRDPPNHHALNHQHPVLLLEVPVLDAQLRLASGLRMLLCRLPAAS